MDLSYVILLGIAVSIDGFFAGIAYGLKNIRVSFLALSLIGFVTLVCTTLAMHSASLLLAFINPSITTLCGALLLIAIGSMSLLHQYLVKAPINETVTTIKTPTKITISLGRLVISIMAKPECADMDCSNHLNKTEALLLGLALGIDNMIATFAVGLTTALQFYTPIVMCVIQSSIVWSGIYLAKKIISDHMKQKIAYAPGCVLILLGLIRL
ncbi:MAG: hypothetical protein H6Q70_4424 [Firmicutes bacterium]|nr:hypothetical protein [Bacillota bacterium]